MKDIKNLIAQAAKAIKHIEDGHTYTSKYVCDRFIKAAEENPKDIMINTMRDVIVKQASSKMFFTQKELGGLYNSFYGFSSGGTRFKETLGDLISSNLNKVAKENKDVSGSRVDMGGQLKDYFKDDKEIQKAASEFEDVFSLNKQATFAVHNTDLGKKAEKFCNIQLKSLGREPKTVRAVFSNSEFILCKASYTSGKYREYSLNIPVQISGRNPKLPTTFINKLGELEKLNEPNLLAELRYREQVTEKDNSNYFKNLRASESLNMDKVIMPKSLEKYAHLEDFVAQANSSFSKKEVDFAKSVLHSELTSSGILNPQIRTFASNERGIVFKASIPTTEGRQEVEVPVEFANGKPLMPDHFKYANKEYEFSHYNLSKFANKQNKKVIFSIDHGSYKTASYHELQNLLIDSATNEDYGTAQDCLSAIQSRFEPESYKKAFDKYHQILKSASRVKNDEALIKKAFNNGELIKVPTSLELYSPKYKVVLSKLYFDEDGKLQLKSQREKLQNLKESEAIGISSYDIRFN